MQYVDEMAASCERTNEAEMTDAANQVQEPRVLTVLSTGHVCSLVVLSTRICCAVSFSIFAVFTNLWRGGMPCRPAIKPGCIAISGNRSETTEFGVTYIRIEAADMSSMSSSVAQLGLWQEAIFTGLQKALRCCCNGCLTHVLHISRQFPGTCITSLCLQ